MLCLAEIREKLKDMNLSAVSRSIGMHRQQLWMLANNENSNPTAKTLERLTEYFEEKK
jgi:transcriptional regulator with XRE-family HTH domain